MERIGRFLESWIINTRSAVVNGTASYRAYVRQISVRVDALIDNMVNAYHVASTGTGVLYMLRRNSMHTTLEYRRQAQNSIRCRQLSKFRMRQFIEQVSEFYHYNTVQPFQLLVLSYRLYHVLVGALLHMRANWMEEKARMIADYSNRLFLKHQRSFPDVDE